MAAQPEAQSPVDDKQLGAPLPRAVEGGTIFYESLGRWIDDLMGDSRDQRRAEETLDKMFVRDQTTEDPEPIQPPPPVQAATPR